MSVLFTSPETYLGVRIELVCSGLEDDAWYAVLVAGAPVRDDDGEPRRFATPADANAAGRQVVRASTSSNKDAEDPNA